eukprot:Sdes_comp19426_c0_seq1m10796
MFQEVSSTPPVGSADGQPQQSLPNSPTFPPPSLPPLQFDISPAKSLGPFEIGMPIGSAIAYLSRQARVIQNVELKYSEDVPMQRPITLNIPQIGTLLSFDASSQKLENIDIYDLSKCVLSYTGVVFNSSSCPPVFSRIYRLLGPSYPGDYDTVSNLYTLNYPGLSFFFPLPPNSSASKPNYSSYLPMELPDGSSPVANRICLFEPKDSAEQMPSFAIYSSHRPS